MKEKAKVLIAESAGEYCAKCASLLKTYGFEAVIVPRDGLAVVQMVGEMRPKVVLMDVFLSLIHISEPTRQAEISYAVFCLKKKKIKERKIINLRHN